MCPGNFCHPTQNQMHEGSGGPCCACAQQGRRTRPASQRPARAPLTSTARPRGLVFVLRVSEDQAHSSLKSQFPHHSHPTSALLLPPVPLAFTSCPPLLTSTSSAPPYFSFLSLPSSVDASLVLSFPWSASTRAPDGVTVTHSLPPTAFTYLSTSAFIPLSCMCFVSRRLLYSPPFSSPAVCRTGTRHL